MSENAIVINTIDELYKFLNDKGVMEVVIRGKKAKIKDFQKVIFGDLKNNSLSENIENALGLLNKNNQIVGQNFMMLKGIESLSKFSIILQGINLCATCIGFAIVAKKLESIKGQMTEIQGMLASSQGVQVKFEYSKAVQEHRNMLDCRKKQKYYSEEQMRELVDCEYNVLNLLIDAFEKKITDDRKDLIFAILSMAAMLSASIKFFDEVYYFNNREQIVNGDKWHGSHEFWEASFDSLASEAFIKELQDYAFLEQGLNSMEADYLVLSMRDQVKGLKQNIKDNQKIIETADDPMLFEQISKLSKEALKKEIEDTMKQAGVMEDEYQKALEIAVA